MQRPQGQRRGGSSATPAPSTTTHATASGTALMRSNSQWLPSGAEEEPQATRVFLGIRQDRFVGGRSSEGPERRGRNAQQTVQVSSGGDRGKRRRRSRGTSRSSRPRTDCERGNHVYRGYHHLNDSPDDTGDHERIPDNESNETSRLLTPPRTAPRTDQPGGAPPTP